MARKVSDCFAEERARLTLRTTVSEHKNGWPCSAKPTHNTTQLQTAVSAYPTQAVTDLHAYIHGGNQLKDEIKAFESQLLAPRLQTFSAAQQAKRKSV